MRTKGSGTEVLHEIQDPKNVQVQFDTVRISFTGTCNMNCFYCHNEGQVTDVTEPPRVFALTAFREALEILSDAGVRSANITGGEFAAHPRWREMFAIVRDILGEVIVTTNGSLLDDEDICLLKSGGVSRFNVSLDTRDARSFAGITGYSDVNRIVGTLAGLAEGGNAQIVVNAVLLRNINDSVSSFIDLAQAVHPHARRINIIRPHRNAHRPGFNAPSIDYYFAFMEKMTAAADAVQEMWSAYDSSMNLIVTIGETRFHFKAVTPDFGVPFCAGCGHASACSEWIIPPRFQAETGEFAGCLLNPEKRVQLYRGGGASVPRIELIEAVRDHLRTAMIRREIRHDI